MAITAELRVSRVVVALCCIALMANVNLAAQQRNATEQEAKSKHLNWSPPRVDAPLPSLVAIPPCDVTKVLEDVGSHALELAGNLQNFTADEQIEYERWSYSGVPQE